MADKKLISEKVKPDKPDEIDHILNPIVKDWFYSKFPSFSLPQLFGVMEIHSRSNVLISAPTGATKTLTGFLSILNELVDSSVKGILEDRIYAVYVSPLKALNQDIKVNLLEPLAEMKKIASDKYGKDISIRVQVRGGDTTAKEKSDMLKTPPHILITTPESLAILLSSLKFIEHLKKVEWCIIDEIHALAENKRGVHLSLSVERLENLSGSMTRIGLSATVSPLDEIAHYLVGKDRTCRIVNVQFIKQLDLKVLSPVRSLVDLTYDELHSKTYELVDKLIQEHKTTLIFTNTRAATERVVHHLKDLYPKNYTENIGAHHGSLSKEHRHSIEERLRKGELKCVVCSTSLELGIDIGYIDLVICLGSPKTVARTLQRIGRSGHKLHATTKGRIIVMDRDDLVECSVILKNAVEKKIDSIHIPKNSLDVLAQHIFGLAISQVWDESELFELLTRSYPYIDLKLSDFNALLSYLAGEYVELEDRHVYAKIWRKDGKIGRRGKLARLMYMTNLGTIPDQSGVLVKLGNHIIGTIDEGFLERLRKRDIFVLGGATYEFRYAKGMTAFVESSNGKPPTVPRWASEMLPLSFDLALDIGRFRRLIEDKLSSKKSKETILEFINSYLYIDDKAAQAIYEYIKEQYEYSMVASDKRIVVEHYKDDRGSKIIFHTMFGRRVNDCLSRAIAYIIAKIENIDVEIGINDNGFYIGIDRRLVLGPVLKTLKTSDINQVMLLAIDGSEILRRRFRHCAERSFMILRTYMGRKKNVGRQQTASMILIAALNRISKDFPILKEARREVLEDLMDIQNTSKIIDAIKSDEIKIHEVYSNIPSPFAFQLVIQGYTDIMKIDDKLDFLKRMHQMVLAKISLKDTNKDSFDFSLPRVTGPRDPDLQLLDYIARIKQDKDNKKTRLANQLVDLDYRIPIAAKIEIAKMIRGDRYDSSFLQKLKKHSAIVLRKWPKDLAQFVISKAEENFSYDEEWAGAVDEQAVEDKTEEMKVAVDKDVMLGLMHKVHKEIELPPLIYFELERFIQDPKGSFDRKFKQWLNELLTPPLPRTWPKTLLDYLDENSKHLK